MIYLALDGTEYITHGPVRYAEVPVGAMMGFNGYRGLAVIQKNGHDHKDCVWVTKALHDRIDCDPGPHWYVLPC